MISSRYERIKFSEEMALLLFLNAYAWLDGAKDAVRPSEIWYLLDVSSF